ncbi:MAG: hypothetical protein B6242_08615 [Anaerolineaceae bacterium 4572_78]|nr:MAG: hypothetical protein B6242_08615 [Anaerolineaceae bacterium 4572_78]
MANFNDDDFDLCYTMLKSDIDRAITGRSLNSSKIFMKTLTKKQRMYCLVLAEKGLQLLKKELKKKLFPKEDI